MIIEQEVNQLIEALTEPDYVNVVLLYGKTCGPCIHTKPHFEMVSNFFNKLRPEGLRFHQMDVWNEPNKVFKEHTTYESVPTIVVYQNNVEINRIKGSKNTLELRDFVFQILEQVPSGTKS